MSIGEDILRKQGILHREEELAEQISANEQVKRQISTEGNYTLQSM